MSAANVSKSGSASRPRSCSRRRSGATSSSSTTRMPPASPSRITARPRGAAASCIMTTLGTGIGTALLYDGVLIPNSELGHLEIAARRRDARVVRGEGTRGASSWARLGEAAAALLRDASSSCSPPTCSSSAAASRRATSEFLPLLDRRPRSCRPSCATTPASWAPRGSPPTEAASDSRTGSDGLKRAGRLLRRVLSPGRLRDTGWTAISLGTHVAVTLQRPTRERDGQPHRSLSGLAPDEVYRADRVTAAAGGLLPHRFTLTLGLRRRRSAFCGTVSRVAPGGCYPPSCPAEPGRSSAHDRNRATRPSCRPARAFQPTGRRLSGTAGAFGCPARAPSRRVRGLIRPFARGCGRTRGTADIVGRRPTHGLEVGAGERHRAAAARALPEQGGAHAASAGAALLVEREELGRDPAATTARSRSVCSRSMARPPAASSRSASSVGHLGRDRRALQVDARDRDIRVLDPLHDDEFLLFEVGEALRERRELGLERGDILDG